VNGRAARDMRQAAAFVASDPYLADARRLLFGDRFKAGFGLKDPAYMPLYPHEYALYVYSQGHQMWDKYHSCEELEAFIQKAPAIELLGVDDRSERWYDDAARLAAKWIFGRLLSVPDDRKLEVTFWEVMEGCYPHITTMRLSTAQKVWSRGAALRVLDGYRADGQL
jgi:hypothetical protein